MNIKELKQKKKDNMFNTYYWRYKDININREIFHRAVAI